MSLTVLSVPSQAIGYGRMGLELTASLQRLGYDITTSQDDEPTGTVVVCSYPSHLRRWREGQRTVCLTMFESTLLPEAFRESMDHYDLIIVPSEQNRELFSPYHPNVKVIPLGIDPLTWKPTKRKKPTTRFNFLIGGSGLRKGQDIAYNAFRMAFPAGSWNGPEPWLTFKSPKPCEFFGERVTQINGRISAEEEVVLYEQAHCYVQPSRGEGFGLQPLQALAQGLPTILTDAHGHTMFAHHGHPVPASLVATPTGSFMLGEAGDWWEPDVKVVAQKMRWIYDHYTEACEHAWAEAHAVHETYTWENSAHALMEAIGDCPPYAGSGEWVFPEIKKYRTILTRPHAAEIATESFQWQPGVEYWETADVKRVLFDGGFLDPACIDGDSGLSDAQVTQARLKSGSATCCYACGQVMNSRPTAADLVSA